MLGFWKKGDVDRTSAERTTLAISVLLLVALIGGLAYLELRRDGRAPRIETTLRFEDAYQHHGDWYVPVTIVNVGDRSTDQLRVTVSREIPGEPPEESDLEYEFVAGHEQVEGIAVFTQRPTPDTVEAHATAITLP